MAKLPRQRMKPQQVKLAAYLGARHLHRFRSGKHVSARATLLRKRLVIGAIGIGLLMLWGLWREFFGG